ncbi:MAG TPA: LytTR family DNA-binding domain-containing protein [Nitrospiraceae bacterium]|nr:LytTR family DNA-binding domain-containing protein [Nitrospiraceae bacterium]
MTEPPVRSPPTTGTPLDRICIRTSDDILLLPVRSVLYVRQDNGHSLIHLDQHELKVRMSLKRLEGALGPFGFFRSHRAFLVNLRRVRRIVPWSRHVHHLLLDDPKETMVPLAKGRKAALWRALLFP